MAPRSTSNEQTNVTAARQPARKRPRLSAPSSKTGTPNAYSRRSPPREQSHHPRSPTNDSTTNHNTGNRSPLPSPPRKLKRPGGGARVNTQAIEAARRRREEEQSSQQRNQQTNAAELVANHYNSVPERGRSWRKTDSEIKGLRSLNNWIKSTLIQKFSLPENGLLPGQQLLVLDMACGKGGDLGKWEKAPSVPGLFVGCDIAEVSVEQARERWEDSVRKSRGRSSMQAEFYVHDGFAKPLGEIARVRQVGFNPNVGPGGSGVIHGGGGGMGQGGFDVVSMMFALHYSYESEGLARGMLRNVSGALKKGGRFMGVMPNSDVISGMVKKLLAGEKTPSGNVISPKLPKDGEEEGEIQDDDGGEDDWDPERPSEDANRVGKDEGGGEEDDEDDWDPEKPSEPQLQTSKATNGIPTIDTTANGEEDNDDWDPTKPSEPTPQQQEEQPATVAPTQPQLSTTPATQPSSQQSLPPLEWGNKIYSVRFPRTAASQPFTNLSLPRDGIFRPPYGWRYHYHLAEAVDVPEYVVPWEAFRALAEEYGLELLYRKGFGEILRDEGMDDADGGGDGGELRRLAERMGVLGRDGRLLVGEEEMDAAGFYHGFVFYRT